jgi:CheY-like chemotaxis protein
VGSISIETANCVVDADACKDRLTARPGDFVRLTVSDTGAGMPPAILAHVFEPFFTTKGVGNGLGLGLATVHGAVSQNEGFIEVTSEPGLGTSFQVYLPRHRPAGSTLNEPMGLRVDGNETILLVDDEPSILRATARMLEGRGYTVLSAPGPKEALALVRTHAGKIHLLLTDVIMPSMNGRDLAQEVVALRPQVRCVFMSGFTAEVLDGKPAVHFLQKPFTAEELSTKVRAALG